jgi:DNA-binding IclR family transcriptional regulator
MATSQSDSDVKLTDQDHKILDLLSEGRCTQKYIVDETGIPRHKVHERLKIYDTVGLARNLHETTALWELVRDPREDDDEA